MWCPECHGEFTEGITRCPDCDVDLVATEPHPGDPNAKLVTVFSTGETDILPLVRSLLEESGIPFAIQGEELVGIFPSAGVGLAIDPRAHAAEVQVPESRAEEARELLAEIYEQHGSGETEDFEES